MVTKEQALGALNECMRGGGGYGTVVEFIEQSQPVPEGFVLVPVEPTEDMTDAGYEAYGKGHFTPAILDCYRAMIAAAPKPGDGNEWLDQARQHRTARAGSGCFGIY